MKISIDHMAILIEIRYIYHRFKFYKHKTKYKVQCLFIYFNTNVRLFSRYDIENTQVLLIIHVWLCLADMLAAPQKYGR